MIHVLPPRCLHVGHGADCLYSANPHARSAAAAAHGMHGKGCARSGNGARKGLDRGRPTARRGIWRLGGAACARAQAGGGRSYLRTAARPRCRDDPAASRPTCTRAAAAAALRYGLGHTRSHGTQRSGQLSLRADAQTSARGLGGVQWGRPHQARAARCVQCHAPVHRHSAYAQLALGVGRWQKQRPSMADCFACRHASGLVAPGWMRV